MKPVVAAGVCLLALAVVFAVVASERSGRVPAEPEAATGPAITITIHSLTPNQRALSVNDVRFYVSSSEALALSGVKKIEHHQTGNSMLLTITNTTDRTFLIDDGALSWIVTSGTRFVDDDGNEWKIRFTPVRFIDERPAYKIPAIAGKSSRFVYSLRLTAFTTEKEGVPVPSRLHYTVLPVERLNALEVIGDEAKKVVVVPAVRGRGVLVVDEEGIR
jgi:hypothetical protein